MSFARVGTYMSSRQIYYNIILFHIVLSVTKRQIVIAYFFLLPYSRLKCKLCHCVVSKRVQYTGKTFLRIHRETDIQ